MYVCICKAVTERDIHRAVESGVTNFTQLKQTLSIATQCGSCGECARSVLDNALAERDSSSAPAMAGLIAAAAS